MVVDTLDQLARYNVPYIEEILRYLKQNDSMKVPDGEHEIKGRELFVRVSYHEPKPAQENKFEAHQVHADVQYVAQGVELMQIAPADKVKILTPYDAKGDYQFFTAEEFITDLVVRQGQFALFYPGEIHRPSCLYKPGLGKVKKLVFKIKINGDGHHFYS